MKKGFAHGAVKLGSAGLLCSAIGSLFRIMLAGCIGTMGIAYYQLAYPIYVLLTVVATSGHPGSDQQAGFRICCSWRLSDRTLFFCNLFSDAFAGRFGGLCAAGCRVVLDCADAGCLRGVDDDPIVIAGGFLYERHCSLSRLFSGPAGDGTHGRFAAGRGNRKNGVGAGVGLLADP